jgi:RAD50-interacting protein 1
MSHKSIYTNTVVDDQYNVIISSADAWLVAEEVDGDDALNDLKPTNSSRRIKSLVEQVTG